jgi:hypothetical protein
MPGNGVRERRLLFFGQRRFCLRTAVRDLRLISRQGGEFLTLPLVFWKKMLKSAC